MNLTKLKRVALLQAGGTPTVDDASLWNEDGSGLPWVSIGDMSDGRPVTSTARAVSRAGLESKSLPVGEAGTLLFAMYASVGAVGRLAVRASWNQAILGISPMSGVSDSRFVGYWLEHLRPSLGALTRSNTQDNLNAEQVGNFPFPAMGLAEQRAIADYLDTETARIDALITKKQQLIHLLEERWMTDLANVFAADSGGESRRVGAYAEVVLGRQRSPKHEIGDYQKNYLRAANVKAGHLDLSDVKKMNFDPIETTRFRLEAGDVLVTEGSGSRSAVGASAVWRGEITGEVCFQNTLLRMRPRQGVQARFLAWWAQFAHSSGLFAEIAGGANIYHLSAERVRDIPMRKYSDLEQQAISLKLDDSWALHDLAKQKLVQQVSLLADRRTALISAAVIGDLDGSGEA